MIYLDSGATSFYKPPSVQRAVLQAMNSCASPGRGGYEAAVRAGKIVYQCRELASELFHCQVEQVVFTSNCTHGLNMAIGTLVRPESRVVISGFEHNAVTRPLHAIGAKISVAGRKLFDEKDTIKSFENAILDGANVAVFTHCSNVFGYILPVEKMAELCKKHKIPFIIDAAQSAGTVPIDFIKLGADFVAMPGHKGLLGPQGTGILLCKNPPKPLIFGGTGSLSVCQEMPEFLPDRGEAGTLNVGGIAGLGAGISYLLRTGTEHILKEERDCAEICGNALDKWGFPVFMGESQSGTISFVPRVDCEDAAAIFSQNKIAVRAGLHCAPLAHESAGTLESGTVRLSFGYGIHKRDTFEVVRRLEKIRNCL